MLPNTALFHTHPSHGFVTIKLSKLSLTQPPPVNARLKRQYVYLSQFQLRFIHLPGLKNEMCDLLSRTDFDSLLGDSLGELAQDACSRMDQQLDLTRQQLLSLESAIYVCADMYLQSEFSDLWKNLKNFRPFCFPSPKLAKTPKRNIFEFSSKPKNTLSVKENFLSHMHTCTAFCNGATQQMVIPHRIELFSFSSFSSPFPVKSY